MADGPGDRLADTVREFVERAKRSTAAAARLSRRQVELLQVEWDLLRRRSELGDRFLRRVEAGDFPGWAADPRLAELAEAARALEVRQRALKDEIDRIRRFGPGADEEER